MKSDPISVLWGERDGWLAPEMGEELAAEIPGARLRFVADAGHFAQEDIPAGFAEVIGDFLIEVDYH